MTARMDMALVRVVRGDAGEAVPDDAVNVVRNGGLIAMPTDSFYALGASVFDEAAVRRVCTIKGQREHKPILALIADRAQLAALVARIPPAAEVLMDRFWPGPLTIVFPASPRLPAVLTAGTGTIGVRWPAHSLLQRLLRETGPLTGTSANRSGAEPARTAQDVEEALGSDVDLIVDGGPSSGPLPSTVVETVGTVRVLREGPIRRAAIEAALAEAGIA
ncbi:MAG: L-threonylcarbamoyladenylate synthase [Nitrospiraceae bacterium]